MLRIRTVIFLLLTAAVVAASCGSRDPDELTVVTHDAFLVSDAVIEEFEAETGIRVTFLTSSDAGTLVAEASLTKDNPVADLLFGIDNTFLSRGLDEEIFEAYASPQLASVPAEFQLDAENRVTPIDYGDVCINAVPDATGDAPTSLDDLRRPEYAGRWVTENPESSSPGLALLLATIATYGEDGWEQFWQEAAANGVGVTAGWTEAYSAYTSGQYSIMTSYASSPVAEVLFAEEPIAEPLSSILVDSCFRQIEFAGVLANAQNPDAARQFIDFMLSDTFQNDVPLNMFVYPVTTSATLPAEFAAHATAIEAPLTLDPQRIGEMRDTWTARWVEIVLR